MRVDVEKQKSHVLFVGPSSSEHAPEHAAEEVKRKFAQKNICTDLIGLLNHVGATKAVFVSHPILPRVTRW